MDKVQPPTNLKHNIARSIAREEKRFAQIYLSISSSIFIASLVAVVFSFKHLLQSLEYSGFYQYASLLVQSGEAFTFWEEFTYSLIESLPTVGIALFLCAFGFFMWSGIRTITTVRRFSVSHS